MIIKEKIINCFIEDTHRYKLWFPVFLGLGIIVYFQLPFEPDYWIAPVFLLIFAFFFVLFRKSNWVYFVLTLPICFLLGFMLSQVRTHLIASPMIEGDLPMTSIIGVIKNFEITQKGIKATLTDLDIEGLSKEKTPYNLRFSARDKKIVLFPGDTIQVRVFLKPPLGPSYAGAYDFARVAYFNQIGGVAFAIGKITVLGQEKNNNFSRIIETTRQNITNRIREILPNQKGEIAAALITGQKGGILEEVYNHFRDSGLAHLLAISGLHFGLIFGFIYAFVRSSFALIPRIALVYPIKKWAICVAMLGAFLYSVIAGGSVPTIRAFIMLGLFALAVLFNRRAFSMYNVAFAALMIMLFMPEVIMGPSFQMSFAAVIALIATYEIIAKYTFLQSLHWFQKIILYVLSLCLSSAVASLATTPFTILHFGQFQTYGIAANLIAIPLTGIWIMPMALISLVLMPFGLDAPALLLMGEGIDIVMKSAAIVASWKGAVIHTPMFDILGISLISVGGIWFAIWQKSWRYFGIVPFVAGFITLFFIKTPHLLIADQAKLIAWRNQDKLFVSSLKRQGFTSQQWQSLTATYERVSFPYMSSKRKDLINARYDIEGSKAIKCDADGCVIKAKNQLIAIPRNIKALSFDCQKADMLIISFKGPSICPDKQYFAKETDSKVIYLNKDKKNKIVSNSYNDRKWNSK
ncbi:MAG: ComEC/Rec2 family competence protein [Alphaproteobacteria bacterium]|nr:ComEC/Rec2 family competence protein [Alphaproteobacteria bacterium]